MYVIEKVNLLFTKLLYYYINIYVIEKVNLLLTNTTTSVNIAQLQTWHLSQQCYTETQNLPRIHFMQYFIMFI